MQRSLQQDNFRLLLRSQGGGVDVAGLHFLGEEDESTATIEGHIFRFIDSQGDHLVQIGDDAPNSDRVADLEGAEIESQQRVDLDVYGSGNSSSGTVLNSETNLCSAALEGAGQHRYEPIDGDLIPRKQVENIADGRKGIFRASAADQGEGHK